MQSQGFTLLPFVSKVIKVNFIDLATRIMLGLPVTKPEKSAFDLDYIALRLPSSHFPGFRPPIQCWEWKWHPQERWDA
jgi:hypothetical protein